MQSAVSLIMLYVIFTSCDSTLKKIKAESTAFKKEQAEKWAAKNEKLKKDTTILQLLQNNPSLLKSFFKQQTDKDNFLKTKSLNMYTGPMDIALAHKYSIEYQTFYNKTESRVIPIEGRKEIPRTKSLWVDKRVIYSFIETFLNDSNLDGIRIYEAKYNIDAADRDAGVDRSSIGKNTVFFVATSKDGNNHKDTYFSFPGSPTSTGLYIYDYNSLCPDICLGGDFNH